MNHQFLLVSLAQPLQGFPYVLEIGRNRNLRSELYSLEHKRTVFIAVELIQIWIVI